MNNILFPWSPEPDTVTVTEEVPIVPSEEIHLVEITDVPSHPKYSFDVSPIEAEDLAPEEEDSILNSEVQSKYSLNLQYLQNNLALETGSVSCFRPDSTQSSNILDESGGVSSGDWSTSGDIHTLYGGDDFNFGSWVASGSHTALNITGDLVIRAYVNVVKGGGEWTPIIKYGTTGGSGGEVYRTFLNMNNGNIYYSHNSGTQDSVQFSTDGFSDIALISLYRKDNGNGTVDTWAYRDGQKIIGSINTGGTFTDNSDGTATGDAPNSSLGVLNIGDDTEGANHDVQNHIGFIQVLNQLPADPDTREEEVANQMLNLTY